MLNEAYNYMETKGKEGKYKYANMMMAQKMLKNPEPVRRDLKLIDFNQTIDLGSIQEQDAAEFKKMKQR